MSSRRHLAPAPAAALALGALALAVLTLMLAALLTAPSASAAASGSLALRWERVGGSPKFAIVDRRVVLRGTVTPYVAGQTVTVGFYLDGRQERTATVAPTAAAAGAGQFRLSFVSHYGGLLTARAVYAASAQQAAVAAVAPGVRYVNVDLGPGARGQSVRLLQSELSALHYEVPLSGVFEEGTGEALIAFRKLTGLERVAYAGRRVFELLSRGAGRFNVRYPRDGRHVEANLTRQVLAEIEPGGRVRRIYPISSGKPSTPTVLGRFYVYLKTPGENSEGMVDSNYFIRGYAIHGYAEVPTYAASHGCLRVPIPDAPAIYEWVRVGTPVDVYYE